VGATLDGVLISHLHHDHCDLATLRALAAPVVVAPPGAAAWLARHGVGGTVELEPGEGLALASGVRVVAVRARHSGRREPWGPTALAVGHVVEGTSGSAWLAGDTGLYPGMGDLPALTRRGRIDIAAVPVWGWGPTLGPGHLDPAEAAEAAVRVGAGVAVPVHWGTLHPAGLRAVMRDRLVGPAGEFAARLATLGGGRGPLVRAHVLAVGGRLELTS
ncbi:MAG TPA: MBL fold metallo-hydrolase, partial [Kineosporiaceae bacterium]|nr:MBL fold metallo-hydrolase [Kineosporiaceae bacterium]